MPAVGKLRALEALRELEFEFETGKMEESDYNRLRARWANEAIEARDSLGESTGRRGGRGLSRYAAPGCVPVRNSVLDAGSP